MQKLRSKELMYQTDFARYKVNPSKLTLGIQLEMPNSNTRRNICYLIMGCMSGYLPRAEHAPTITVCTRLPETSNLPFTDKNMSE